MSVDAGLALDLIMITLLAATIFYALRLERRLSSVRNAQAALGEVIRDLNDAAARADVGIQGLKVAAMSCGQDLDSKIKQARVLADDLSVLLKVGDGLGQRIESGRSTSDARLKARAVESLRALAGAR